MMKCLTTALLFCASCMEMADNTPIPRGAACDEQATVWCDRIDDPSSGCRIVYRHWCGMEGEVSTHAQDACLDAIRTMKPDPLTGWYIPDACAATFATAPPP